MSNKTVYIYHGNCFDGTTAVAIALQKHWTPNGVDSNVTVMAGTYGTAIDVNKLKGKHVCFLDYSASKEVMLDILDVATSVTVMDHHISIHDELASIDHPNFKYVYDVNLSGAQIAWREFMDTPEPLFIKMIGDRDLWTKKYPHSDILQLALKVEGFDVDKMYNFIGELAMFQDVNESGVAYPATLSLINRGLEYNKYHQYIVEQIASRAYRAKLDDGTPVMKVNCPPTFISDVGAYLYARYEKVAWLYNDSSDRTYHSLRVSEHSDYNASVYAKERGGGGHVKACGWVELHKA